MSRLLEATASAPHPIPPQSQPGNPWGHRPTPCFQFCLEGKQDQARAEDRTGRHLDPEPAAEEELGYLCAHHVPGAQPARKATPGQAPPVTNHYTHFPGSGGRMGKYRPAGRRRRYPAVSKRPLAWETGCEGHGPKLVGKSACVGRDMAHLAQPPPPGQSGNVRAFQARGTAWAQAGRRRSAVRSEPWTRGSEPFLEAASTELVESGSGIQSLPLAVRPWASCITALSFSTLWGS